MGHGADLVAPRNEQSRFAVSCAQLEARQRAAVRGRWTRRLSRAPEFLDEVCASDQELRAELEALLAVGDSLSAKFLEPPSSGKFGADGGGL